MKTNRKGLIKIENQLEKVGNQIAITNKLLVDSTDYMKWWADLPEIWKSLFRPKIERERLGLELKSIYQPEKLTIQEKQLLPIKEIFEDNSISVRIEFLRYLSKTTSLTIGRQHGFTLPDLNPLKIFLNLEEIDFINATIEDIMSLKFLPNLKSLYFSRSKVKREQIEEIKTGNLNCEIRLQ